MSTIEAPQEHNLNVLKSDIDAKLSTKCVDLDKLVKSVKIPRLKKINRGINNNGELDHLSKKEKAAEYQRRLGVQMKHCPYCNKEVNRKNFHIHEKREVHKKNILIFKLKALAEA